MRLLEEPYYGLYWILKRDSEHSFTFGVQFLFPTHNLHCQKMTICVTNFLHFILYRLYIPFQLVSIFILQKSSSCFVIDHLFLLNLSRLLIIFTCILLVTFLAWSISFLSNPSTCPWKLILLSCFYTPWYSICKFMHFFFFIVPISFIVSICRRTLLCMLLTCLIDCLVLNYNSLFLCSERIVGLFTKYKKAFLLITVQKFL